MKRYSILAAVAAFSGLMFAAVPARAGDICLQFSGASCDLSGDLGFFRFMGAKKPKTITKPAEIHGRACGFGTVTGTMVLTHDGGVLTLSGNFVCDATAGAINAEFSSSTVLAPGAVGLGGLASYGDVNLGSSCDVAVVDCATEP